MWAGLHCTTGLPDECDITTGVNDDAVENGIPDECEGQRAQGGGSGGSSATGGSTATTSVVVAPEQWAALYEWTAPKPGPRLRH